VFENRVLRRIFGPKRDEATGGWRKLHNEEVHNLYSLLITIKMVKSRSMRLGGGGGHKTLMAEMSIPYKISIRKPEGKRLFG
jgi:hypothetical protein